MCEQIVKAGSLQCPIWGNIESVRLTEEPLRLKNPEMIAYSEGEWRQSRERP